MGKSKKKEKSEKINLLRTQYEAFLEDDRKRRERNEYILQRLDKMRSSVVTPSLTSPPPPPHGNDEAASVLKTRATNMFSETPKISMQAYSPLPRRTFLSENTSSVMPTQNSQNIIISKDMTENSIEQTILKEISKKYILIPKIRSPYNEESEIKELSPHTTQDQHDNEWKSKYDILETLNSVDDTDDKSYNTKTNKREIINKGDKKSPLFEEPTKDENGTIYTNTKVSWTDEAQMMGNPKYNHESPARLRHTTFSNDTPLTKAPSTNNYVKTISSHKYNNETDIKTNIDVNKEIINNYENDKTNKYLNAHENYDKDTENEKGKIIIDINNRKLNEQHLNMINKSPEIETSQSFEELKQQENITISQNVEPSQYDYVQSDLEYSAPESKNETYSTVTQEFEKQQYSSDVTNSQVYAEVQDLHNTQQHEEKYLRDLIPESVKNNDKINNLQRAQQCENNINQETELNYPTPINASQENNNDQGWTEQQHFDQVQVEHLNQNPQTYSQQEIGYNQVAYSEPPYDQYDYSQIPPETEQNYDPNIAYVVPQHKQDPNQSALLDDKSPNAVPEERQSHVTQDQYLNNDDNQQYEGHYQQSDVPGEYQQDISQGLYLTNEGQNQYQQENVEGQNVPSDQYMGQYQQSGELSTGQDTQPQVTGQNIMEPQVAGQNIHPLATVHNIQGQYEGQYQQSGELSTEQNIQGQYVPSEGQNQCVPTVGQVEYDGQYQNSDGLSAGQYLPSNGQDQYEVQYQQHDGQGDYQQPVHDQYLPNDGQYAGQYQQSDGTEQYPQNNEQRQYLPNEGQGQYQYETDLNYTQQQYAEYNAHEAAAPADVQQAPIQDEEDRPAVANIQPIVANTVAQ